MAKKPLLQSFAGTNTEAHRVAARQAANFVTVISEETRANLRNVITRSIAEGIAPRDAAQTIRTMVGLTQRQGQAAMNYRAELVKQGLTKARIAKLTEKYAAKQLKTRAETIARTEVMDALNEGQKASWRQARREGLLGLDAEKEWMTVDQACPRCAPMDGQRAPLDGNFSEPDPPLHPRCLCTLSIVPGRMTRRG